MLALPLQLQQTVLFQAKADVVWNDTFTVGLRFLRIEPACLSGFEAWLDSLEAQLHFRDSAQSGDPLEKRRVIKDDMP